MRLVVTTAVCGLLALVRAGTAAEDHAHGGGHERGPFPYAPVEKVDTKRFFTGNTMNAVAYVPSAQPQPGPNAIGASSLSTVMFQAYLREDGTALVRAWDPRSARYTPTAQQFWSVDGDTMCLAVPAFQRADPLCLEIHVWGLNFAGYGINGGHGMIKGDVKPGRAAGF